jgi:hypothetical protein
MDRGAVSIAGESFFGGASSVGPERLPGLLCRAWALVMAPVQITPAQITTVQISASPTSPNGTAPDTRALTENLVIGNDLLHGG